MSQLAKAVRGVLSGLNDYAAKLPGGISPEVAPAGVATPFGVYTGVSVEHARNLDGTKQFDREEFELTFAAKTRSECETLRDWALSALGPGSWSSVVSPKVFWWRVDTSGDVSEVLLDGADDVIRQVRLTVVGAFR